jgi:hypothetical protein
VLLASTFVLVGAATPCYACSCIPASDEEQFQRADVVFTGRAVERHDPNEGDPYQGSGDPIHWTFDVESVQKGKASKRQVVSSARDGATCGRTFTIGRRYQVFATAENGELATSLCDGTRELAANQDPYTPPPPPTPPPATATPAPPAPPTPAPSPTPAPTLSPTPIVTATPTPTPTAQDVTPTAGERSTTAAVVATVLALTALGLAIGLTLQRSRGA